MSLITVPFPTLSVGAGSTPVPVDAVTAIPAVSIVTDTIAGPATVASLAAVPAPAISAFVPMNWRWFGSSSSTSTGGARGETTGVDGAVSAVSGLDGGYGESSSLDGSRSESTNMAGASG